MIMMPSANPLIDDVRRAVGHTLSDIGEASLQAFFALPEVAHWKPRDLLLGEVSRVFDIGLPIALIAEAGSADGMTRKISHARKDGISIKGPRWSEIQAGALIRHLGGQIEFVKPRKNMRTPDIRSCWGSGSVLDVEVTAADAREIHRNVRNGLAALSGAIQAVDHEWHVLALVADAGDERTLRDIMETMIRIRPGESAEGVRRWFVKAYPPEQRDRVIGDQAIASDAPEWWPHDDAKAVTVQTLIGSQFSPTVKFVSLYPEASYMNPIARKAERPQHDPHNPYLIAVDVKELPRAHTRVIDDLRRQLTVWDHVSGVLLFDYRPWIGVETKQWEVSLHLNSSATAPLPEELVNVFEQRQRSIIFKLSA